MTAQIKRTGCGIERLARFRFLIVLFLALILAGCGEGPSYRLVWSADGKHAVVFASDGVRLTDGDGNLSKVILDDADHVAWTADSKGIAIVSSESIKTWDELKKFLTAEEQQQVIDAAGKVQELAAKGKSWQKNMSKKDSDEFGKIFSDVSGDDVVVYLKSSNSDAISLFASDGEDMPKIGSSVFTLRSYQLQNESLKMKQQLYQTKNRIVSMTVSPGGSAIALVEHKSEDNNILKVVPLDGGKSQTVAESVSKYTDWLDSKTVVFIEKNGTNEDLSLGRLQKSTILNDNGNFEKEAKPDMLAKTAFDESARVQCRNGRVFFSSTQNTIPCDTISSAQRIFMIEPGRLARVVPVMPDRYVYQNEEACNQFDVSPNGQSIAILETNGFIDVIDTASGDIADAQNKHFPEKQNKAFLPHWRSNDELCFAAPIEEKDDKEKKNEPANKRIAEVVLWSPGKKEVKTISKKWPAEAVHFLEKEEEKKQDDKNDTPKSQ